VESLVLPVGACGCLWLPMAACLAPLSTWKTYALAKGPSFALHKKKAATDLTREMLQM